MPPVRLSSPGFGRIVLALIAALHLGGCSNDDPPGPLEPVPLADASGGLGIQFVVPASAGPGYALAAADFVEAATTITGAENRGNVLVETATASAIVPTVNADLPEADFGEESYRFRVVREGRHTRWIIEGRTETAVMYGVYDLLARLGVRYHHPEETFFPSTASATLPVDLPVEIQTPHYRWRGFHEHTQHPTEWSDYLLQANPEHRPWVTRYLQWYARNRQNTLSWHMLKSVDLDTWIPWIAEVIEEAEGLGIEVGMVLSFLDEQQNNFKIVDDEVLDPETGEIVADDIQIRSTLDRLASAGFRFFALQIGSSEFTKPDETRMVGMMNLAANHLAAMDPPVRSYAWIHTTCSLKDENGDYFFHLPNRADTTLGAWVHTTMFYTLDSPAPVYDCESFSHHLDFLETEHTRREQIYFPESAWWLGFDNNTPVTLPITGWSRHHDIAEVLAPYDVRGHVTFTTGREWLYWQYDHHLTRVTWDPDVTWQSYLQWLAPIYGEVGPLLADVLDRWAEFQVQHFYVENPEIYFYYAGELQQDEIGEQAGIIARRPKIAYRRVVAMDDNAFAAWKERDFDMLVRMHEAYGALFEELPPSPGLGETLSERLYHEAWETLRLSVRRLEHAIAVYAGVIAVREYVRAREEGEVSPQDRQGLLDRAERELSAARAISSDVIDTVSVVEALYRYPLDILAEPKPSSLTSYPYGYLWETRTGHFWTRRDHQLQALIEDRFETVPEEWSDEIVTLAWAEDEGIRLLEPANPLAREVLEGFIPRLLFGFSPSENLHFAQDYNENFLPDRGTETVLTGARNGDTYTGTTANLTLTIRDDAGAELGELLLLQPSITVTFEDDEPATGSLIAQFPSQILVDVIIANFGIDERGVIGLLKQVFDIPRADPLPERLPVHFAFELETSLDDTPQE